MPSYAYTNGDGLTVLDVATPDGATEPVANLDEAIRQIKAYLKDPEAGPEALINSVIAAANPPGTGKAFFGGTVPDGYLLCDGSAVSRTTYSALFAAIGTTWGAGDASTTFNLPDSRGRFLLGEGTGTAADATSWSLGTMPTSGAGGEEQHTLVVSEMPSHAHSVGTAPNRNGTAGANPIWANDSSTSTGSEGGDQPHNNMPPLFVAKWIIKT